MIEINTLTCQNIIRSCKLIVHYVKGFKSKSNSLKISHFNLEEIEKENPFQKNYPDIPRKEILNMIKKRDLIDTKEIKSSGPGGQHINKTNSCVMLKDKISGLSVKVNNSRDKFVNSKIAEKRLLNKLDLFYNESNSNIAKKHDKIKKQKETQRRRSAKKYNH